MKSKPINFFLVDDDTDDASLFEEILNEIDPSIGFKWSPNGQEALGYLKDLQELPDLIFLDLNMPMMGGKECLTKLKKDDDLRHIPVLMYSTSSYSKDIEEAMMSGALCFITKPTSVHEIKQILSSIAVNTQSTELSKTLRKLSTDSNSFIVC